MVAVTSSLAKLHERTEISLGDEFADAQGSVVRHW